MNARSIKFEMSMEAMQVDEVVASIFHTVLFHRSSGKFTYNSEESYSIGTVGYVDVDCEFIDFTYVRCQSEALCRVINREIENFSRLLRGVNATSPYGSISLEFYQRKRARWPFQPESVPWEIWTVCCELTESQNQRDRHTRQESVVETLQDKIVYVTDIINRYEYVPKMPSRSDADLIFDRSFTDIQPYLFNIHYSLSGARPTSVGNTVRKLIRDSLSM